MLKIYGVKVSYFTGKMEAYLRMKEIPFRYCSITMTQFEKTFPKILGAQQIPVIELDDGQFITDTSPMIDWFEDKYSEQPILPSNAAMAFFARLIEDYADEYLWRSAMHYRWSYRESGDLLCRQLVNEAADDLHLPKWIKNRMMYRRQLSTFVKGDGVTPHTWAHVEDAYLGLLKILDPIFAQRAFLFGARPCLADVGLMGPLLRHFSMDPVPSKIMREEAPHVMEWVMRVWNAKLSELPGDLHDTLPDDLKPLIRQIGETHLAALNANADATIAGQKTHNVVLQGTQYEKLPSSHYRVWCLTELHRHFANLIGEDKAHVEAILEETGALGQLTAKTGLTSDYNKHGQIPFGSNSLAVFPHFK